MREELSTGDYRNFVFQNAVGAEVRVHVSGTLQALRSLHVDRPLYGELGLRAIAANAAERHPDREQGVVPLQTDNVDEFLPIVLQIGGWMNGWVLKQGSHFAYDTQPIPDHLPAFRVGRDERVRFETASECLEHLIAQAAEEYQQEIALRLGALE
ncbi:MAG: hypothetical protein KIT46_04570 [Anaerolineales bacterium]|nr:hypothetical protein [Anaerolineales bacterium]